MGLYLGTPAGLGDVGPTPQYIETVGQQARWHRRVAERLEAGYGSQARELAGELALHCAYGQEAGRAARYRQYAAEQALSRQAYTEAGAHCQQGLELLAVLPARPARAAQELSLRLALSIALTAMQGFTSEVLAHNLHQALGLCDAVEATTAIVPVLAGLTRVFMVRGDRAATERLMARERALLLQLHDAASFIQLHTQLGTAETFRGAYVQAEAHHRHVLHGDEAETQRSLALSFGMEPMVAARAMSAWRLWLTGWPDQAAEYAARAEAHATRLAHPFSLVYALLYGVMVRQGRGDLTAAAAAAQHLASVAREQGAKALELRAAISLSRLWLTQDKATAAQQLLAGCYHGFSEGFDTVDLHTARSVLARCQPVA